MTLKIAVLVKQVPDLEAVVQVKSATELDIENRYLCSFFDEIALEMALTIKKNHPEAELLALSAGGKRATEALRRSVAMGIDRVIQLGDEQLDACDSFGLATVLASKLKQEDPQLILCGKQAGDDDMAAIGPMVAELLGIAHVSAVVGLELDPAAEQATVERMTEGGSCTLAAQLPLLLSAEKAWPHPTFRWSRG